MSINRTMKKLMSKIDLESFSAQGHNCIHEAFPEGRCTEFLQVRKLSLEQKFVRYSLTQLSFLSMQVVNRSINLLMPSSKQFPPYTSSTSPPSDHLLICWRPFPIHVQEDKEILIGWCYVRGMCRIVQDILFKRGEQFFLDIDFVWSGFVIQQGDSLSNEITVNTA